jgi:hypothetical protein
MEAQREQIESWKQNPWHKLPTWAKWTIGVVGALIIFGLGAAAGGDEGDLEKEVSSLEGQLAQSTRSQKSAEERAERIEGQREQILETAHRKAARIEGNAVGEANQASDKLASLKAEVSATESELEEVEDSLGSAEQTKALSTFGEGIVKSGVDYEPGTYEAQGGEGCYWALLNSANTNDMAGNEFTNNATQQIIEITTPYFQSEGCGTWERIE